MNSQRDPHDVLGVRRGASRVEIRAAYRRLARKVHPDVDDGRHSDEMAALNEAYRTLTSEPQRAQGTTQARPHADPRRRRLLQRWSRGRSRFRGGALSSPLWLVRRQLWCCRSSQVQRLTRHLMVSSNRARAS